MAIFFASAESSLLAYIFARFFSKKGARWVCSEDEMNRYGNWFDNWGEQTVIISRLFPILPEVTALTAGFMRMKFKTFLAALITGSLPVCFFYTWLGHTT